MAAHIGNLRTGEAEMGEFLELAGHPGEPKWQVSGQ